MKKFSAIVRLGVERKSTRSLCRLVKNPDNAVHYQQTATRGMVVEINHHKKMKRKYATVQRFFKSFLQLPFCFQSAETLQNLSSFINH